MQILNEKRLLFSEQPLSDFDTIPFSGVNGTSLEHLEGILGVIKEIVIAECKGKKSEVEEDDVEDWLTRAIPAFRAWVDKQEIYKKKRL